MDVSIIIPALNEERNISAAIDSAWKAGANEVIVVDGGSSDNTLQIIHDLNCTVLRSKKGRAVQQNTGAKKAICEVLLFLHADNRLGKKTVAQITNALSDPKLLYGCFRQRIDASGAMYRFLEIGNAWRARRLGLPYGDQGIFIRREAFYELGAFPEEEFMEDFIFMKKLRRIHKPVMLAGPIYVNARRWQEKGIIRQTIRNWLICAGYYMGMSPQRLSNYYPNHCDD